MQYMLSTAHANWSDGSLDSVAHKKPMLSTPFNVRKEPPCGRRSTLALGSMSHTLLSYANQCIEQCPSDHPLALGRLFIIIIAALKQVGVRRIVPESRDGAAALLQLKWRCCDL